MKTLHEFDYDLWAVMQTGHSAALTPSAKLRANLHGEDKASSEFWHEVCHLVQGKRTGGVVG